MSDIEAQVGEVRQPLNVYIDSMALIESIRKDVNNTAKVVALNAADVTTKHGEIKTWHSEMNVWQGEVQTNKDAAAASAATASAAKTAAETAKASAETAVTDSETAKSAAEAALTATTNAKAEAVAAKNTAVSAKDTANTAAGNASSSATSAANSSTAANNSKNAAAGSASAAATAKTQAETAKTASVVAQGKAEDAQQAAETAESGAATSKMAAETAETNANTHRNEALLHKNSASDFADDAADSATAAAGSASSASSSASAASGSKSAAASSATTASSHKDAAAASAALSQKWAENPEDTAVETGKYSAKHWSAKAEDYKNTANTYQNNAKSYRDTANTYKGNAATSASNAANSATAASSSESAAASSASSALSSKNAAAASAAQAAASAGAIASGIQFKGAFDASGGATPSDPTGEVSWFYRISVAGVIGGVDYQVGDQIVFDPTTDTWFKIDNTDRPITNSLTSTSTGTALSANAGKTLNDSKLDKSGGDITGTLNHTPDTGAILTLDGKDLLVRHNQGGGISFGADNGVIIGSGESRATTSANVDENTETLWLASDNGVEVLTNMQTSWAARKTFLFNTDGSFSAPGAISDSAGRVYSPGNKPSWGDVTGKPSTYAPSSHTHTASQITDLSGLLNAKLSLSGGTMTGNITMTSGDNDGRGIFWGSGDALAYIRQTGTKGQIEIGSDDQIIFKETDADSVFLTLSANNGSVTATGPMYASGNQRVFADNYHPNADKLTTARTITLAGDVSGSTTFDGSANKTVTVTVKDDSHNHTVANVDGLQAALDAKSSSSHNHDSLYYTKAQVNASLAGKLSSTGKAADANLLDGKDSTQFAGRAAYTRAVTVANGGEWVTFAYVDGGGRASARFKLGEGVGGKHGHVEFYAAASYGNVPTINILSAGGYGSFTGLFRRLRIIKDSTDETYGVHKLQVLLEDNASVSAYMYEDEAPHDRWKLADLTEKGLPTGYGEAMSVDLDKNGGITTSGEFYAQGGARVYHENNPPPGFLPNQNNHEGKSLMTDGSQTYWGKQAGGLRFEDINRDGNGYRFDLALGFDGRIYIWGHNTNYNIAGAGQTKHIQGFEELLLPVDYDSQKVTQFGGMGYGGYVLFDNGELWGWGSNNRGQLGNGTTSPVQVPSLLHTGVLELSLSKCGSYHFEYGMVYIRKSDGWYGFGANNDQGGRLGNGDAAKNQVTPQRLGSLPDGGSIIKLWNLGCHLGSTFVLSSHGNLYGTGANFNGSLGIGTNATAISTWTPVIIDGSLVKDIRGGYSYYSTGANTKCFTLFLLTDGRVFSVGNNSWGQLGQGLSTSVNTHTPADIGLTGVDDLHVQGGSPAAIMATYDSKDKIHTWGYNSRGALGLGHTTDQTSPQLTNIVYDRIYSQKFNAGHVNSYYTRFYLVKSNGEVWATGDNTCGVMMTGDNSNRSVFVKTLFSSKHIKSIMQNNDGNGGLSWVHVLLEDGTLYGCGNNGVYGIQGIYNTHTLSNNTYMPRRML